MQWKRCAGCSRGIAQSARICDYCGHVDLNVSSVPAAAVPPARDEDSVAAPAVNAATSEDAPAAVPPQPAAAPRGGMGSREIGAILIGVAGSGILCFALLSARGSAEPAAAAPAPAVARADAAPAAPPAASASPRWTTENSSRWVGNGRKNVAFELAASNKVQVWLRPAQPMLVVRCLSGSIEAFVYTESAAKMEPQDDQHTVRLRFDDQPGRTERWPDSDEHDALFAPDGAGLARQIAQSQKLLFGFTPHNADPVVAQFDTAGLGALMEPFAKQCGLSAR